MKYHFLVHDAEKGIWAECCELDGCVTQADAAEDLYNSCEEALNLYLEESRDTKIVFPLPDQSLDSDDSLLKVSVEPEIALAVLLRHYRKHSQMTQKQASKLLGMKNIYSYQRLEKRSNPTLGLIKKIHSIFPEIELGYLFD